MVKAAAAGGGSKTAAARPASDYDGGNGPSTSGEDLSSVVYIGHLPHGFYEDELLGFFSQFGRLTRVRMSRNKKTGRGKHYAFLEFQHADVAQVVAEAMDGHLMFAQRLAVRVLRKDEVHPQLFKGANRRFKNIPWRRIEAERHNKERTAAEHALRVIRLVRKDTKRQKRIAAAGIVYEYEALAAQVPAKPKKLVFD